jgi:hypothetical protein
MLELLLPLHTGVKWSLLLSLLHCLIRLLCYRHSTFLELLKILLTYCSVGGPRYCRPCRRHLRGHASHLLLLLHLIHFHLLLLVLHKSGFVQLQILVVDLAQLLGSRGKLLYIES